MNHFSVSSGVSNQKNVADAGIDSLMDNSRKTLKPIDPVNTITAGAVITYVIEFPAGGNTAGARSRKKISWCRVMALNGVG